VGAEFANIDAMQEQEHAMIHALVAAAWSDNDFADAERDMLRALLDAYDATAEERRALETFASVKRTLADIDVQCLSAGDRRLVLQHAVLLSFADGKQSADESEFLRELAAHMRIESAEATSLIALASDRARKRIALLA
jgi:tellurite resistance protein